MTEIEKMLTRRRLLEVDLALPPLAALAGTDRFAPPALGHARDPGRRRRPDARPDRRSLFHAELAERKSIVPAGATGTRLTLTGRVLRTNGSPVANALIDWWQADARGAYDNSGFRFRGHQFTDARGRYSLLTVVPGLYPGRTKHIHVKVQAPRKPVLTTQLFFPGVAGNRSDGIFTAECLIAGWKVVDGRRVGRFDFVLDL